MNCTIDTNVFVASARFEEVHHAVSLLFLDQVQLGNWHVYCPSLVLPESAAALVRATDDPLLANELVTLIVTFPNLYLESLTLELAQRAAQIAIAQHVRGADAVYLAVAEMSEAMLVTWDREIRDRGQAVVNTMTPQEWLVAYQAHE
jgi:predicted nucleic acid-binding protein